MPRLEVDLDVCASWFSHLFCTLYITTAVVDLPANALSRASKHRNGECSAAKTESPVHDRTGRCNPHSRKEDLILQCVVCWSLQKCSTHRFVAKRASNRLSHNNLCKTHDKKVAVPGARPVNAPPTAWAPSPKASALYTLGR